MAERAKPLRRNANGVIKGGSFLCAAHFCVRYRATARHPQEIDRPTSHVGFRTVRAD
ncbi:SUMF1/EgtB/PvdO family nonheme iron enzyme [Chitinolyticbacter albus]|uniref:SUMF1/EgtB/PvdO family nonheme iron enzyme n=1 Tax=Chitinolyticbacter albus TaxID=2961951 RepID=UPI00210E4AEF|nr:SUMF1/EgtB/PvdO family nonheme iron enzyme [Chitinolyticbacter albus]